MTTHWAIADSGHEGFADTRQRARHACLRRGDVRRDRRFETIRVDEIDRRLDVRGRGQRRRIFVAKALRGPRTTGRHRLHADDAHAGIGAGDEKAVTADW